MNIDNNKKNMYTQFCLYTLWTNVDISARY